MYQQSEVIKVKCGNCDSEVFMDDNFCRYCGEELPDRDTFECPECAEEVFMEDNFCFNCGTKFDGLDDSDDDGEQPDHEEESMGCCCGHEHPIDPPHNAPEHPDPHHHSF